MSGSDIERLISYGVVNPVSDEEACQFQSDLLGSEMSVDVNSRWLLWLSLEASRWKTSLF